MRYVALETPRGILSRLSNENYLYKNGQISFEELVKLANDQAMRWLTTCPHIISDIQVVEIDTQDMQYYKPCITGPTAIAQTIPKTIRKRKKVVDNPVEDA